jgi:hypothetical protein
LQGKGERNERKEDGIQFIKAERHIYRILNGKGVVHNKRTGCDSIVFLISFLPTESSCNIFWLQPKKR